MENMVARCWRASHQNLRTGCGGGDRGICRTVGCQLDYCGFYGGAGRSAVAVNIRGRVAGSETGGEYW